MCSAHNKGKLVVAERFIRTLNGKIYKKGPVIIVNLILVVLNKLVDELSNSYHCSICKKPIDVDDSVLSEETETNREAPTLNVTDSVKITKYKNIFSKSYTKNWSREIFAIDSVLKTNPWMYRIKDSREKK